MCNKSPTVSLTSYLLSSAHRLDPAPKPPGRRHYTACYNTCLSRGTNRRRYTAAGQPHARTPANLKARCEHETHAGYIEAHRQVRSRKMIPAECRTRNLTQSRSRRPCCGAATRPCPATCVLNQRVARHRLLSFCCFGAVSTSICTAHPRRSPLAPTD